MLGKVEVGVGLSDGTITVVGAVEDMLGVAPELASVVNITVAAFLLSESCDTLAPDSVSVSTDGEVPSGTISCTVLGVSVVISLVVASCVEVSFRIVIAFVEAI